MSTATLEKPKKTAAAAPVVKPEVRMVRIDLIKVDFSTQLREKQLDEDTVLDYRRKYEDGVNMPPIPVFFDGEVYRPGGGHHRYEAQRLNGAELVKCEVYQGTQRDALFYAARANSDNGLQRRPGDLRKAVTTLLKDPEWSSMTDGEIARHVVCARSYVTTLRNKLVTVTSNDQPASTERTFTRAGKTVTMNTAGIAQANAARATKPEATPQPPATEPAPQPEPDGLDKLVQLGGRRPDARASDDVSGVHDHLPPENREQIDSRTAGERADAKWAADVLAKFDAAATAAIKGPSGKPMPTRIAATIFLHLGLVGDEVAKLNYYDFDGADAVVRDKKVLKLLNLATDDGKGLIELAMAFAKPGTCKKLDIFQQPSAAPVLAFLLEGWGVEVPVRPTTEAVTAGADDGDGDTNGAGDAVQIPEKPDGQSLTWYQWAKLVQSSCGTLGCKVGTIKPEGVALELYRQGLKPKAAAKRIVELASADSIPHFDKDNPFAKAERGGADHDIWKHATIFGVLVADDWNDGDARRISALLESYNVRTVGDLDDAMKDADQRAGAAGMRKCFGGMPLEDAKQLCGTLKHFFEQKQFAFTTPAEKSADDFDDNNPPLFTADGIDSTLDAIEKADAVDAIKDCTKVFATVRSIEFDNDNWVVLGQKMVRGRQCWRLCRLDPSDKDDLGHTRANAAAEAGVFNGIGVIDLTQGKKARRKINDTEGLYPAAVIYVRQDKESE